MYQEIEQMIRSIIDKFEGDIGPSTIAMQALESFGGASAEPHVRYAAIEHFKQISRGVAARQWDPVDGDESESYQDDMFSGHLQDRYPIPHKTGEDPTYRRRELLTSAELDWNITHLEKSADARLRHADALRLYRDQRK